MEFVMEQELRLNSACPRTSALQSAATVQTDAGIACLASSTHRACPEDSQDAAALALPADGGYPTVLVADGLGSFAYAGEAARFSVREAARLLATTEAEGLLGCDLLFPKVQTALAAFAGEQENTMSVSVPSNPGQAWGTTLLAAQEVDEALLVAYVGNGGIFHLRGDFAEWGERQALPWSFANYLNPHSVLENGQEALYRYLSACGTADQSVPTMLGFRKDARFGDAVLLCTDGVFSPDQVRYGNPGDGSVWGEVPPPLIAIRQALQTAWGADGALTTEALQTALATCLEDLRERRALDDDATVGLLVTARALTYRNERQEARARRATDGGR